MDAGVGEQSGRLRHEMGGDEGSTKDSAINSAMDLNTPVADNRVAEFITNCLLEVVVDHGLCLGEIANAIDSDFQFKLSLDVA